MINKKCRTNSIKMSYSISLIKVLVYNFNITILILLLINFNNVAFVSAAATATSATATLNTASLPATSLAGGLISNKPSCTAVHSILVTRGLNPHEIPKEPLTDSIVKYCEVPSTGTCCNYNMEQRLANQARMQLEKNTKDIIGKLASVLGTRAQKFNEYFKELLAESKKEFHTMFKRTYGVIYEQNSYVFSNLFNELERYYNKGNVDLSEALDLFFNTLYQKMFTVLNSQYQFDDKYLGCVSEHMKELKPFGDVPNKLSVQIKRSFVATRTLQQALNAAADVAKNMMTVRPSAECTSALTKLQQCGVCNGYSEKPCANYCVNVMKGCLSHFSELDVEWDHFVGAMDRLTERLLGPFNIVMVVEPINIKISEAIMNFQETGTDISSQVFQGCGKPILGRRKRNAHNSVLKNLLNQNDNLDTSFSFDDSSNEITNIYRNIKKRSADPGSSNREIESYEPIKFTNTDDFSNNKGRRKNNKNRNNKQQNHDSKNDKSQDYDTAKEPVLNKLIKDIKQKIRDSKNFWSNLAYQICNNEDMAVLPANEGQCWNGRTVDRYLHAVSNDIRSNPEFPSSPTLSSKQSNLIANKLFILKTNSNHLRNAHSGLDVEWTDQEENPEYGSGSGAGISAEDDDTGSGIGPFDLEPRFHPDDHTPPHSHEPNIVVDPTTNNITETTEDDNTKIETKYNDPISDAPKMSIHRALFTYLFPIFVAWFGGCFSDLL